MIASSFQKILKIHLEDASPGKYGWFLQKKIALSDTDGTDLITDKITSFL
jgi:hypothetical protein